MTILDCLAIQPWRGLFLCVLSNSPVGDNVNEEGVENPSICRDETHDFEAQGAIMIFHSAFLNITQGDLIPSLQMQRADLQQGRRGES